MLPRSPQCFHLSKSPLCWLAGHRPAIGQDGSVTCCCFEVSAFSGTRSSPDEWERVGENMVGDGHQPHITGAYTHYKDSLLISRCWQLKHVYFHPENWGNDPIWRSYFSHGLVQPPTSFPWWWLWYWDIYIHTNVMMFFLEILLGDTHGDFDEIWGITHMIWLKPQKIDLWWLVFLVFLIT